MFSLVKIRVKYIIRKPCLLFWTYILIPSIILIAAIFNLKDKKEEDIKKYEKLALASDPKDFLNDNYKNLKDSKYLYFTSFIVDKEENCKAVNDVLEKNNISLDILDPEFSICNTTESKLSNLTLNIIKISKKKDKYKVTLKCKGGGGVDDRFNETYPNWGDIKNFILYNQDDLDEKIITDAFYVNETNIYDYKIKKYEIFFELQSFISKIIINLEKKSGIQKSFKMELGYNKYPDSHRYVDTTSEKFYQVILMSFLVTLQFALISYNINMRMIDEKENKLNNLLERQGMSKSQYTFSWFLTYFSVSLISLVAIILLIYGTTHGKIYLFVINMILFLISSFSVCVFFNVCIKTVKTGATALKFYNFGTLFLGFVLVFPKTTKWTKIVFSFIPHINFFMNYFVTACLGNFDNLSFDLLFLKAAKISYFESFIMYIVEIIVYFGLSIFILSYQDSGLPFCYFLKSCCTKVSRNVNIINSINNDGETLKEDENSKFEKHFQELSEINKQKLEQNNCLKLVNVSKSFGDLKAVNCFNGELFSNEIFCLLGHNGAGKTTTINMISGIYDPDEGDILLNGRSLVTDKKYLYENIGLCQQENIFFDYLTVEEHLKYMCEIKGSRVNYQEIDELITKIDLSQKKKALCSTLSGGQKRKLCIALALIGNSRIILLDEPTSGMDVMARRSLWEFLKNYKKDKIILLTTHFLDEAEYLGDRIGIMSEGQYICCGSSSYLKSKYPCGFNINLIINSDIFNENFKTQFYNDILKYEPNAEIKVASKGIFSVNIQSNNQHVNEIFDYIEKSRMNFGIEDYTVASTSLEDVFLSINNKTNLGEQKYVDKRAFSDDLEGVIIKESGFLTQLRAQIIRAFYPLYRNKTLFFFELLSGLGIVYIFIFFFSDSLINLTKEQLNLINVLKAHTIYIYGVEKEFIKNSDVYDSYGANINFPKDNEGYNSIEEFMDIAYKNAFVNIAKGALLVKKNNGDYEVYNTETNTGKFGYFYANTMLFVSSFLKKEYDIKASIFTEIEFNHFSSNAGEFIDNLMGMISLAIICLINFFGFIIFLGGLMLEKIKEKRTNIKHLLYLSGSNIFSYWIGFFYVDYIKLLIFSILLILPIYRVSDCATYFGYDMLLINISSLSFIYFITFFCSKDGDGAKILFLFVFSFIIIIVLLLIVLKDKAKEYIFNFKEAYKPTFFDMTPVTSMLLSFIRIMVSFTIFHEIDTLVGTEIKINNLEGLRRPEIYLFTSYISQIINFVFYSLLLILAESGLLGKLIHIFQLKFYGEKDIKNVPMIPIESANNIQQNNLYDTSFNINNVETPLINKPSNITPLNNNINTSTDIISKQNNYNQDNQVENSANSQNIQQNLDINFNGENLKGNPLQNPYVQSEIKKVYSQKELSTRIINVTKTFYPCCGCCNKNKVRAINHLHLGLEPNEKFGLLGFNGSGKTTTFRAITNEILFDCGNINLFGYDTKKQFNRIRTMIGYCPQINPLFDFMKVREIIQFYSQLKTCNENPEVVCEKFGLSKYLDTYTINLSGGNKRKLTFAIAMMNRPTLLLLDEPSTGVDPESRRIMWKNINELSNSGHKYNMILTTHSMEEAEILCDTVSWFRSGNFITLGNPEKLKIRYSAGYKLHIKFDSTKFINNKQNDINQTFNQICSIINGFNNYSNYILANPFFEPYLNALIDVVQKIRDKLKKISLYLIGRDYSFELVIIVIDERKKDLFCDILNMKNTNETIDELTISMQSLENILTSLD